MMAANGAAMGMPGQQVMLVMGMPNQQGQQMMDQGHQQGAWACGGQDANTQQGQNQVGGHPTMMPQQQGFEVPYFNTFFLKGTIMKYKFILFSPWLLKSPGNRPSSLNNSSSSSSRVVHSRCFPFLAYLSAWACRGVGLWSRACGRTFLRSIGKPKLQEDEAKMSVKHPTTKLQSRQMPQQQQQQQQPQQPQQQSSMQQMRPSRAAWPLSCGC